MEPEKYSVKRKNQALPSREELLQLDKQELVDRLQRVEAHNLQLKNIISKSHSCSADAMATNAKPFDYSKCHSRPILLRIMYLGWDYLGLATQEDTNRTIEHELFAALTKTRLVEKRETAGYHRCGRTDKGVSSFGQVISLKVRSKFPPGDQYAEDNIKDEFHYCKMLNRLLPKQIRALCWMPAPKQQPEFSARFDCTGRHYRYYFPRGDLDTAAMARACRHLLGAHDMRNLCKMDVANGVTQFVRTVRSCRVAPVDAASVDEPTSMYCLRISGDGFLWHQIRCVVAVLLLIGQGLESDLVVKELLDVDKNPRKPQYSMALDIPLNLFQCDYELDSWLWDKDELRNVITCLQTEWTHYSIKSTMIKDCLENLEEKYDTLVKDESIDKIGTSIAKVGESIDTREEKCVIKRHADCLLEGVKSKVYKPLMQREKCSSLEERIDHYTKKRRIEPKAKQEDS